MDQNQDELQQAINNITNNGGGAAGATDVVSQVANKVSADLGAPAAPAVPATPAMPPADNGMMGGAERAMYGDPDLDRVKSMALSDLRPILEKIDIAPEKKFMIYKDIIELTDDKACIEPAYNAAKQIQDDAKRAEALVYVVEFIDKLGIPMPKESDLLQ
jgi:hypothetical protein